MLFKSSYIVTENNGYLRCDPFVGRRPVALVAVAMLASVLFGVAAFAVLTGVRHGHNRVTWVLQPPVIVKTTARSVAPAALQAAGMVGRGS